VEFERRISRDGRAGGANELLVVGGAEDKTLGRSSSPKTESARARSSLGAVGIPISTRASRVDRWLVSSRRIALCVASRAEGDGGRGAGFIVCATTRGIVEILHEEMTGSKRPA
jgi:hypothetical protein